MILYFDISEAEVIDRCYRPLCFSALGDEAWGIDMRDQTPGQEERVICVQLGIQGTCTLIKYVNKYFAIFARHQIAMISNEGIEHFLQRMNGLHVLMDDGHNSWNLPINEFIWSFDTPDDGDEDDFVVAVVEKTMMLPFMTSYFFPVARHRYGEIGNSAQAGGYPHHLQELLMQPDGNRTVKAAKLGNITQRSPHSVALLEYPPDGTSIDGLSGGPVFVTRIAEASSSGTLFATFIDGMIQRGGNGFIRYLTIERILEKIDRKTFVQSE